MINKAKLYLFFQLVSGMEDAAEKLEEAHIEKNVENFEKAKKILLEFQKKLTEELEKKENDYARGN